MFSFLLGLKHIKTKILPKVTLNKCCTLQQREIFEVRRDFSDSTTPEVVYLECGYLCNKTHTNNQYTYTT